MRLHQLRLPTPDPDASVAFYRDVLQLPVSGTRVGVGWSEIELVATDNPVGSVHLAFNLPHARFDAAIAWLAPSAALLHDSQGRQRFHLDGQWQSDSVYFAGPDGAVLELIARQPLGRGGERRGPFAGEELLCLSEVGLPTADVAAVRASVATHLNARPLGPVNKAFAALGDHEGLLIVVDHHRPWFPQLRQQPWAQGIHLTLQGPTPGTHLSDATGWQIATI